MKRPMRSHRPMQSARPASTAAPLEVSSCARRRSPCPMPPVSARNTAAVSERNLGYSGTARRCRRLIGQLLLKAFIGIVYENLGYSLQFAVCADDVLVGKQKQIRKEPAVGVQRAIYRCYC